MPSALSDAAIFQETEQTAQLCIQKLSAAHGDLIDLGDVEEDRILYARISNLAKYALTSQDLIKRLQSWALNCSRLDCVLNESTIDEVSALIFEIDGYLKDIISVHDAIAKKSNKLYDNYEIINQIKAAYFDNRYLMKMFEEKKDYGEVIVEGMF